MNIVLMVKTSRKDTLRIIDKWLIHKKTDTIDSRSNSSTYIKTLTLSFDVSSFDLLKKVTLYWISQKRDRWTD